ncbi:MAG: hypothetical protein QM652_06915 [Legionella sp.]|uniref:hypothetical protein n=1 Tax=Legionella sp. TaxID=459 RepID=UPI0039E41B7F
MPVPIVVITTYYGLTAGYTILSMLGAGGGGYGVYKGIQWFSGRGKKSQEEVFDEQSHQRQEEMLQKDFKTTEEKEKRVEEILTQQTDWTQLKKLIKNLERSMGRVEETAQLIEMRAMLEHCKRIISTTEEQNNKLMGLAEQLDTENALLCEKVAELDNLLQRISEAWAADKAKIKELEKSTVSSTNKSRFFKQETPFLDDSAQNQPSPLVTKV